MVRSIRHADEGHRGVVYEIEFYRRSAELDLICLFGVVAKIILVRRP